MYRQVLIIPKEEVASQFNKNKRQDVKIVAPEIITASIFNLLKEKGISVKAEVPLEGNVWQHSLSEAPNKVCSAETLEGPSLDSSHKGPFTISFANEYASQDEHAHAKHWEIYFSEHTLEAEFKTDDNPQEERVVLKDGGAIAFGPRVRHNIKLSGLTIIIEVAAVANDKY